MLFCEMVRLTVQPGEQLRVLAVPPQLNKELVGRQVAVRIVDVGWCAGLVVSQSSGPRVQSYNYKVRFDAATSKSCGCARRATWAAQHFPPPTTGPSWTPAAQARGRSSRSALRREACLSLRRAAAAALSG